MLGVCLGGNQCSRQWHAFMSTAPSPYIFPSSTLASKGSASQPKTWHRVHVPGEGQASAPLAYPRYNRDLMTATGGPCTRFAQSRRRMGVRISETNSARGALLTWLWESFAISLRARVSTSSIRSSLIGRLRDKGCAIGRRLAHSAVCRRQQRLVEGHDRLNAPILTTCQVAEVSSRQSRIAIVELSGLVHIRPLQRPHLCDVTCDQ